MNEWRVPRRAYGDCMTLNEIGELSQGISARIDIQRSLLITVHLAVFGGVMYVDRHSGH